MDELKRQKMKTHLLSLILTFSATLATGQAWLELGNASLNQNTHFVGNTDNIGLTFRTNNAQRMRLWRDQMGTHDYPAISAKRESNFTHAPPHLSVMLKKPPVLVTPGASVAPHPPTHCHR